MRRYLAPYVIDAASIRKLCVVAIDDNGLLAAVDPFSGETAATEYFPGIIALMPAEAEEITLPSIKLGNCTLEDAAQKLSNSFQSKGIAPIAIGDHISLHFITIS